MLGAEIKLDDKIRKDALLFGEAPSRIIVSVSKDNLPVLEKIIKKHSVTYKNIGIVVEDRLAIECSQVKVVDSPLSVLSDTWRNAIPSRLEKE